MSLKVLVVCSGNAPDFEFSRHQAFIYDQIEAIKKQFEEIDFDTFFIRGRGIGGYLKQKSNLIERLKSNDFDCIHAHVAQSGLLANLQRRVPVITTFHGSDINVIRNRLISLATSFLSKKSIYVSENIRSKAIYTSKKNSLVIPCGVDLDLFKPIEKKEAKRVLNLKLSKKYILFSSAFKVKVKNSPLAEKALRLLNQKNIELLELKGYDRYEVSCLFSAVEVALMTSFSEGSPQFIKEAMACNCPIVSTNVGDVKEVIRNTDGCYITGFDPKEIADALENILSSGKRTNGRDFIHLFDNRKIAQMIMNVYKSTVS